MNLASSHTAVAHTDPLKFLGFGLRGRFPLDIMILVVFASPQNGHFRAAGPEKGRFREALQDWSKNVKSRTLSGKIIDPSEKCILALWCRISIFEFHEQLVEKFSFS